jgi:hypothetical protein
LKFSEHGPRFAAGWFKIGFHGASFSLRVSSSKPLKARPQTAASPRTSNRPAVMDRIVPEVEINYEETACPERQPCARGPGCPAQFRSPGGNGCSSRTRRAPTSPSSCPFPPTSARNRRNSARSWSATAPCRTGRPAAPESGRGPCTLHASPALRLGGDSDSSVRSGKSIVTRAPSPAGPSSIGAA